MNKKLPLTESVEDYLESILVLSEQLDHVRSVDVASYLGFSKPSVSHAVKLLQEEGLLQIDPKKYLILTENGKEVAQSTYRRHLFFSEMLENIGVPRDIAQKDACRIEHIISEETFEAIQNFYQKAEQLESKRSDDSNS
ncbi:metal-dependent transcriptional regulator [Ileibacterium valens]|nr:metal-dependent transcriptional regulator [Ileibacterium valens]